MKFAYSGANGGVRIVTAATKENLAPLLTKYDNDGLPVPFTDADYVAHVLERNGVSETEIVLLPDDWRPPDGPRGSWVIENGNIVSDAVKAAQLRLPLVRLEAQRRIIALVGATDLQSCLIRQLNANMRANELNDIRHERQWTEQEATEAAALRVLADQIKAIRAASNVLELAPPEDFADDRYWP